MNPEPTLPASIGLIDDLHLGREHVIGTYLLRGEQPALVDPGPACCLPALEAGLAAQGLSFYDVRSLLLTHIHLDHAGATGTIVQRYPHIQVYVHERGATHMLHPEKLLASATRLYGEQMDYLWGEFLAVPEANLRALAGGETLRLGGREVRVHYAPGHASHHVFYHDQESGAVFVGDTGGVRLPGFRYARPATPPPDINLELWDASLGLLASLGPQVLCPTHFGPAFDVAEHIASYREHLWSWAELVRSGMAAGLSAEEQIARLQAQADAELGGSAEDAATYNQATPLDQSWQGLVRYWTKRQQAG
ncbi:MBL fold metallo-hydrolase [Chloroflexia bacterium SDU3-3]|nr:MBL fold metallo-hydrolase [Chloroflexia bacterium SDU3-3]